MDEKTITNALIKYFGSNGGEWAFFPQLRLGTGWDGNTTIDFFAMNLYPSKNFKTIACEIKTSRNDFHREKCNPTKWLTAFCLVDCYYFVAPEGLLEYKDLPEGTQLWEYLPGPDRMGPMPQWKRSGRNGLASLVTPSKCFVAAILRRAAGNENLTPGD